MNFKRISSCFLLLVLLISNISVPLITKAQECEVSSTFRGTSSTGEIKYTKDKIVDLTVSKTGECSDKKVSIQVVASYPIKGKERGVIDATKTPIDVPFEKEKSVSMKFKISEELCHDYTADDFEEETLVGSWLTGGDNKTGLITELGLTPDEFYSLLLPVFTQGESSGKLSTSIIPLGLSYENSGSDKPPLEGRDGGLWWYKKEKITDSKTLQKTLDHMDDIIEEKEKKISENGAARYILSKIGASSCNYKVKTIISGTDGSNPTEKISDIKLRYSCGIGWSEWFDDCGDGVWEAKSGFSPGIRPTVVTESLCLNKDGTGYDENCYEPLAPIPGFGRKLNFSDSSSEDGTQPFTLGTYVGTVVKIAIGAASVAAVIFLTYAGIMYMVAGKSGGGALLDKARKRLISIAWGVAVILGSWIILNTINPELLKINPKFEKVTLEAPELLDGKTTDGATKTTAIKYTKNYSPNNACPGQGNQPNTTCSILPTSIKNNSQGKFSETNFVSNLQKLNDSLSGTGITMYISESWKPSREHKAKCHALGTCIDGDIMRGTVQSEKAEDIKIFIEKAAAANLCAVYEILNNVALYDNLEKLGLEKRKNILHFDKWISGNHFSIYNGTCK